MSEIQQAIIDAIASIEASSAQSAAELDVRVRLLPPPAAPEARNRLATAIESLIPRFAQRGGHPAAPTLQLTAQGWLASAARSAIEQAIARMLELLRARARARNLPGGRIEDEELEQHGLAGSSRALMATAGDRLGLFQGMQTVGKPGDRHSLSVEVPWDVDVLIDLPDAASFLAYRSTNPLERVNYFQRLRLKESDEIRTAVALVHQVISRKGEWPNARGVDVVLAKRSYRLRAAVEAGCIVLPDMGLESVAALTYRGLLMASEGAEDRALLVAILKQLVKLYVRSPRAGSTRARELVSVEYDEADIVHAIMLLAFQTPSIVEFEEGREMNTASDMVDCARFRLEPWLLLLKDISSLEDVVYILGTEQEKAALDAALYGSDEWAASGNAGDAAPESEQSGKPPASVRSEDASVSRAQDEPSVPGYELSGLIGRGGFGAVYRGRDAAGVERAIKVLAPSALAPQVNAGERFQREAEMLARAKHRGVVQYIQLAHNASGTYLVMELIRGRSLSQWAVDQDDTTRVGAVLDVLDALQHLHDLGIVHRDLKPSNILVEDETNRVVIVDLGLAWMLEDPSRTMTQASAWSPGYAPPEVLADPRASRGAKHDIYSTGVVLYEILAGQRPVIGHRTPLTRHRETLAPIDAVLERALAHVDGRFETASAFADALREAQAGVRSPWHTPMIVGGELETAALRGLLGQIAQRGADGDLGRAVIAVAGLGEATRIHYTREYRRARSSDALRLERLVPATVSPAAVTLFPNVPQLHSEPVLAEDKHGPVAVTQLGFTTEELAVFERGNQYADDLRRAHERGVGLDTLPPPVAATDVARALTALASKLRELETREPEVVRSFAELIQHSV